MSRLDIACDTGLRARALVERLSPSLGAHGVQIVRVGFDERDSAAPCKLRVWVRCDGARRGVLVRFVEHLGKVKGVRHVQWQSVPCEASCALPPSAS